MSQLASQFDCENVPQLVAALVVQWNLPRATEGLFQEVEGIDNSPLSLSEKVVRINALRSQFQT